MTPSARLNGVGKGGQRRVSGGAVAALFLNHLEGESLWLLGPGYAPRKRYLYTSLRFFLGINMATECCLSTTTARLEGVNRPCGGGAGEAGQAAFGSCRETRWKEPSRRAGPGSRRVARDAQGAGARGDAVGGARRVGHATYLGDVRT